MSIFHSASAFTKTFFIFLLNSIRGSMTLCWQPSHLIRTSAPIRIIFHALAPHGWPFFISTISFSPNSFISMSLPPSILTVCVFSKRFFWRTLHHYHTRIRDFDSTMIKEVLQVAPHSSGYSEMLHRQCLCSDPHDNFSGRQILDTQQFSRLDDLFVAILETVQKFHNQTFHAGNIRFIRNIDIDDRNGIVNRKVYDICYGAVREDKQLPCPCFHFCCPQTDFFDSAFCSTNADVIPY